MTDQPGREPARDPQDLERLLIDRQWAGDIDGMVALFQPDAVIDTGAAELTRGHEAIPALCSKPLPRADESSSAASSARRPSTATSR